MDVSSVNGANVTSRGTKIQKAGADLDKNAFLRILTAELSNQDPTNSTDSTQYVAQMAQFSSLEQMSNLNTNIALSSANSMIGKNVTLQTLDANGDPYSGILRAVSKDGSNVKIGVQVNVNGKSEIDEFSYDDITGVYDDPNNATSTDEASLLAEAGMIGKNAEFNVQDSNGNNYTGTISGIVKNGSSFDLSVLLDGSGQTKQFSLDTIVKLFNSK